MEIGKKIYYEIATGYPILDIGERSGDVRETTGEEDFGMYLDLQNRTPSTVNVIQIPYGQDKDKFGIYPYTIQNGALVWDLANPINPQAVEQISIREQLTQVLAENQALNARLGDVELALADIFTT